MKKLTLIAALFSVNLCYAQQDYYDVNACEGCGLRLWGGNPNMGLIMGNGSSFHYGPVIDYSIKTLMDNNTAGRGFVWGAAGVAPIAALSNVGDMQIAGGFKASSLSVGTQINSRLIALYDYSSDWYGFGIQSSQMRLQVGNPAARFSFFAGDTNEVMTVQGDGKVGIGTTAPGANTKLTATGGGIEISATSHAADASLHISTSFGGLDRLTQIHPSVAGKPALNLMASTDGSFNYNWWSWGVLPSGSWALQPGGSFSGSTGMFITNAGNVGIGTTSPNQKLTVNGTIYGREVKVDLSVPGPDYVFEEDYDLASLDQVKSYIDENKHLPEVPSAVEMEKNGINLSEMNMLLLKKVEELTLYVIEIKKENEIQKRMSESQGEQIQKLTAEVRELKK